MISLVYAVFGAVTVTLAVVFTIIFVVTKSFKKAFIIALIIFKISVILLAAYGVDKTLFYIIISTRRGILKIHINASYMAFLASFMLLISTIFSEYFLKYIRLPESVKKAFEVKL